MKKLLITGASGFLGWHVFELAGEGWQVVGTCYENNAHADLICVDIADYGAWKACFESVRPDAVIHTAAMTRPNECASQPELSYKINVEASANIAGLCSDRGIPLVFTSSDLVFDGERGSYKETDATNPVSLYGEHKKKAEERILDVYPEALICRLSLMFGISDRSGSNHFSYMAGQIRNREAVRLFTDEFRTPVSGATAARGLLDLVGRTSGVLHLGGRERMSRYEMGIGAAEAFGLSPQRISGIRQRDLPMAAARPADVSLDSSQAFSLGYDPAAYVDELRQLRESFESAP